MLPMRKLRLREVQSWAQDHPVQIWTQTYSAEPEVRGLGQGGGNLALCPDCPLVAWTPRPAKRSDLNPELDHSAPGGILGQHLVWMTTNGLQT